MFRTLTALLVFGALALLVLWQYRTQYTVLEQHQQSQQSAAVEASRQPQLLCEQAAVDRIHRLGLNDQPGVSRSVHFNRSMQQCYMVVRNRHSSLGTDWKTATVYDDQGRVFGSFGWRSDTDASNRTISPYTCTVTLPTGEHRDCGSEAEFQRLIGVYMDG